MDYATIARKLLEPGRKYVRAELKKDAANRYSLRAEWWLPALRGGLPAGEYAGEIVNISSDGETTLVWYNPFESTPGKPICDGASCFPDVFLGIDLRPGSVAHDCIYRELEAIAAAFGVSLSVVRKFADDVFESVNLAENAGKPCVETVSSLTYWGVRLFGGIYHRRHIAVAVVLAFCILHSAFCILLSGCVSTVFEDPGSYVSPEIRKVAQNGNI